ncbi:MAG: DNA polymerase III subunit delta [Vicinamibacterales bacterium]
MTAPLYLVEGGDVQSRNGLAQEFFALVDEGLHAFNVETLHAADASSAAARDQLINSLLSTARTLPMMSPRRLILVHDAERLLSPKRAKDEEEPPPAVATSAGKRKRAATHVEELESYFESPEAMTTVVFVSGPLDANRRLVKLLRQHAVAVDSGSLASPTDAERWIRARLEKDEMWMEQKAVSLLLEATGLDLGSIRSEIEKLILYASGETSITATHVREVVIPQDEPGEGFVMGDAFRNLDVRLALREIGAQLDAGIQPPQVLGQIRAATHSLRPDSRLKPALDAVFQTDIAIKSSAGAPRHLLERLVIELCAK